MYRGTTPTISLTVNGLSELQIHSAYLTIKQGGKVIEKIADDITIDGDSLKATLSQTETLGFEAGLNVSIQLRVLTKSSTAYATKVLKVPVEEVLKDGEIT